MCVCVVVAGRGEGWGLYILYIRRVHGLLSFHYICGQMKLPEGPPLPSPLHLAVPRPSSSSRLTPPPSPHLKHTSRLRPPSLFSRSFCPPPTHPPPSTPLASPTSFLIFCRAFWQMRTPPNQDKAAKSRKTLNCLELPCESKQIIYPSSLHLSIKHSLNLSSLLSL